MLEAKENLENAKKLAGKLIGKFTQYACEYKDKVRDSIPEKEVRDILVDAVMIAAEINDTLQTFE